MRIVGRGAFLILAAGLTATDLRADDEDPAVQQIAASYYAAKYRIDTDQARERLALQDRATGIEDDLGGLLGDQYAGIWYDGRDRGRLKIGLTTAARPLAEQILNIVRQYGVEADTDLVPVRSAEAELVALQANVRAVVSEMLAAGRASTSYDTSINSVVVRAITRLSSRDESLLRRVQATPGVVVRRLEIPSLLATLDSCHITFCDPPMRGGRQIVSGSLKGCTAAFMGRSHSNPDQLFALTAGHCNFFSTSTTWSARDESHGLLFFLGNSAITQFSGAPGLDAGAISIIDDFWEFTPAAQVVVKGSGQTTYNPTYPIKGDSTSSLGKVLCQTGATTGTHCAEVSGLGTDHAVSTPTGSFTLLNMGELDMCDAKQGDSGGPIYKNNRAFGIHSSTVAYPPFTCFQLYQGVRGAEKALGVDILVSP